MGWRSLGWTFLGPHIDGKWWIPVTMGSHQFRRAVLDTGSSHIIFPGSCEYPRSPDEQIPEQLRIDLCGGCEGGDPVLFSPCMGITREKIGGVAGQHRHHYEFWLDFEIPGLPVPDLVPVIFMRTNYPIIGLAPFVASGFRFQFERRGAWVKCPSGKTP